MFHFKAGRLITVMHLLVTGGRLWKLCGDTLRGPPLDSHSWWLRVTTLCLTVTASWVCPSTAAASSGHPAPLRIPHGVCYLKHFSVMQQWHCIPKAQAWFPPMKDHAQKTDGLPAKATPIVALYNPVDSHAAFEWSRDCGLTPSLGLSASSRRLGFHHIHQECGLYHKEKPIANMPCLHFQFYPNPFCSQNG